MNLDEREEGPMSDQEIFSIETRGGALLVTIEQSDMDWEAAPRLKSAIISAVDASGDMPVVLVLTNVGFIASMGLSMFVELMQEFRQQGRRFILCGIQPEVRKLLALTHLDKVFEILASVDEVIRRLEAEGNDDAGSA